MSIIIDLDSMKECAGLKSDDETRGVRIREIFREWENVKTALGNPPLSLPTVIDDPGYPVHFGITLEWKVLLNMASVPGWLRGAAMLSWLKSFPISHEIGHYVFCPYDGITHARLAMKVMDTWTDATDQDVLFIINYFSDIIVNSDLYSINGDEFFNGMKQWIEYTTFHVLKSGSGISVSYLVFIHVHELLWQRRFMTFNYSDEIRGLAAKIASVFQFSTNWYDSIKKLAMILKHVIEKERYGKFPGNGTGSLTNVMMEKMRSHCKGSPVPGKSGTEPGASSRANETTSTPGKNDNVPPGGNDCMFTSALVKKDGKTTEMPLDLTIFMGDPLSTKTIGEINEDEKKMEGKNLSYLIRKMDIPYSTSKRICKFMKIAETEENAWRFWLRSRAEGLLEYDTMSIQSRKGGEKVPSDWEWGSPVSDWNLMLSMIRMPIFPFPPFASGQREYKGPAGMQKLPEARDLLIARDSSGSMSAMMSGSNRECWTNSVNVMHKTNNKFNLSCIVSFAALLAAMKKGAWFSVINFSTDHAATPWLKPTMQNLERAEQMILHFQHNGTIIPVDAIGKLIEERKNAFVLVITDGYLHNWSSFFKAVDSFKNKNYEIMIMFMVEREEVMDDDIVRKLDEKNIRIHYVTSPEDLVTITIRELGRMYA